MILQTIKVHIEKNNKYWLDINEIKLYQIYHFQLFLLHQGNILLPQYLQNLLLNKKKMLIQESAKLLPFLKYYHLKLNH